MKKFNFLDVLIVLVIIVVAVVGVNMLRGASGADQTEQTSKLIYTVEETDATIEQVEAVKVGDRVSIGVNGVDSSVVTEVVSAPAEKVVFDTLTGEYVKTKIPERYSLQVTCEADATVTDMAISAGSTPVRVGAEFSLKGRGYAVIGYVVKSELVEVAK